MLLKGKVAFLTGSTRGIGWSTAKLFAEHGATVVLNGRASQSALDERVAEIRDAYGTPCAGILSDVSDPKNAKACYAFLFREYKQLDILVNNAGVLREAVFGMITEPLVAETLNVNAVGPIFHLQEASRLMGRKKSGSIINLTSIIGRVGNEGQSVYAAAKAAVIGLTLSAAKELAPKGIRVNAVAPGYIKTDMMSSLTPEKESALVSRIKMGRAGTPEDVAKAILFLASDLSAYVTGQVLGVDGGMLV